MLFRSALSSEEPNRRLERLGSSEDSATIRRIVVILECAGDELNIRDLEEDLENHETQHQLGLDRRTRPDS